MDVDTDIPSHKRDIAFNEVKKFLNSFGSDIVRVGTFKKEKPKSAVQTACRSFGLPTDVGLYISSLIPIESGESRSISDCYYGNSEDGFLAIPDFKKQIDKYEGLLETMLGIEGLVCGRGTHSCGVIISDDLTSHTAIMKAPNGEAITQYDLGDCEYCGLIKYDHLLTQGTALIQLTLEDLIENGHIEWQGNLRDTYNKYLHPDVLDFNNPKYFEAIENRRVINIFQFETVMGLKVLDAVKPHSLLELAAANTLMRLKCEGEQPMERYVRIKANPEQFEEEMVAYGLNESERQVLHEYLDRDYGVCSSQESLMMLSMDERISGFGVVEANGLRKSVAKKKPELREEMRLQFYKHGQELGTRKIMLDYVWNVQFATQFGLLG